MRCITTFFNRKTRVSYYLAVMVTFIHNCSFSLYPDTGYNNGFRIILTQIIPSCAVPLFFILSGAMVFREGWNWSIYKNKGIKRVRTLVIPYILWNIVGLLFVLFRIHILGRFMNINATFEITFPNIINAVLNKSEMPVLWFIEALIILFAISPVFYLLAKNKWLGCAFIVIWVILSPYTARINKRIPYAVLCYFVGVMIGLHYFDKFTEIKMLSIKQQAIDITGIAVVLVIEGYYYFCETRIPSVAISIVSCVYALLLWDISIVLFGGEKPREYESNSIMLYFMHPILLPIISNIMIHFMPNDGWFAIFAFVICNIILYLMVEVICKVAKRFMPKIYGAFSGER